eukprot:scaffold29926_cov69-Phaeocystis_antarctica.AAC.7
MRVLGSLWFSRAEIAAFRDRRAPEAVKASCRHGSHAHISLSLNYKTIAVRIQIPKITTEHGSISKPPRPRAGAGLAQGLHNPL